MRKAVAILFFMLLSPGAAAAADILLELKADYYSGWTIDLHIDQSHCKTKPADLEVNLGGLSAGIGFGYRF